MESNSKKGLFVQAGVLAIAGMISRVIGLLYAAPLAAIIGDEGNGYYAASYAVYSMILLISSYSIPSAMSKIISGKLAVREYRNAHRIFKCALFYVTVVGALAGLAMFFGAEHLATGRSATVLRFFAPTIFLFGFLGVLRGYFQAHRTMIPTSISQLLEQIFNAVMSVGMAIILTRAAGTEDPSKRAMYGAIGSAIGTGTGVVTGLLFMLFVYNVNRRTIRRKVDHDLHEDISILDIAKVLTSIMLPFIFSTCIYNLSTVLNSTLFNRMLIEGKGMEESLVAAQYGIFNRKAMNITNLPIAFASAAAAALIPEVSASFARGNKSEAGDLVARVIRVILMIAIPSAVGLFALARPVMMILYPARASLGEASKLLMILAVTVVFYSLSTLTNAVLQGIGKVMAPVINAVFALGIQTAALVVLLKFTDLGNVALCIVTILYSLLMCIMNHISLRGGLRFKSDFKKTYLLPTVSAAVMGCVAFGVYRLFALLFGLFVPSEYFTNLLSTMIAVGVAIFVYFLVLVRSGGATEEDIRRFPKGAGIVSLLRKIHIL